MKIVYFSWLFPLPPHTGGKVRLFNTIKQLRKNHDVTFVCWTRNEEEKKLVTELEKLCHVVSVDRRNAKSPKNVFFWLFSTNPFNYVVNSYNNRMTLAAANLFKKNNFDVVIVESFYSMGPFEKILKKLDLPKILIEDNIEWKIYRRYSEIARNPLVKLFWLIDSMKMQAKALNCYKYFDYVFFVSKEDLKYVSSKVKYLKSAIFPNGVDYNFFSDFKVKKDPKPTVSFLGNFKYLANQDAVSYLVSKVMPLVWEKVPSAQLLLIGSNPTNLMKRINNDKVKVTGSVKDVRKFLGKSWVMVSPLRIGSGTQLKIIEASAMGVPVVGTNISLEGLKLVDKESFVLANTENELAEQLVMLLSDGEYRTKLGRKAQAVIREYDWSECIKPLVKVISSLN